MAGSSQVVIAGTGLVCCLGKNVEACTNRLLNGEVDATPVPLVDAGRPSAPYFPAGDVQAPEGAARLSEMLQAAVGEAFAQAGTQRIDRARMAVFVGSTSKDIGVSESLFQSNVGQGKPAIPLQLSGYGNIASDIARCFALHGPRYTFNTACAASADAFLYAVEMIRAGIIEQALVVGAELANAITINGFSGLLLLASEHMRPFDRHRNGVLLGEGVGAVVLGRADRFSPAPAYDGVRYLTGATLCDNASVTASAPEGIAKTMQTAMERARVAPSDIGLMKVHGTATVANDLAEGKGMRQVFGDAMPMFTSVKSSTGHTLGACGIIEMILMFAALQRGAVPATRGFAEADPALNLHPLRSAAKDPGGVLMLNYFGFGGSNTTLLFGRE